MWMAQEQPELEVAVPFLSNIVVFVLGWKVASMPAAML